MQVKVLKQSAHLPLAVLMICFVLAMRFLSGPTFISSAIEHAEIYSGTCLTIDPHCYVNAHKQVELEDDPSSALNLSFHLLSNATSMQAGLFLFPVLPHALHAHALRLLMRVFPPSIFHPPR